VKSALAVTVRLRFLFRPLVDPLIVNGNAPLGVTVLVLMVKVTGTGLAEVGKIVLDG